MLPLLTVIPICFNLSRVFVYSITESEIAPLKSQLEELDTEITEMVRLKVVLIKFSAKEQVSEVSVGQNLFLRFFSDVFKQHLTCTIF